MGAHFVDLFQSATWLNIDRERPHLCGEKEPPSPSEKKKGERGRLPADLLDCLCGERERGRG